MDTAAQATLHRVHRTYQLVSNSFCARACMHAGCYTIELRFSAMLFPAVPKAPHLQQRQQPAPGGSMLSGAHGVVRSASATLQQQTAQVSRFLGDLDLGRLLPRPRTDPAPPQASTSGERNPCSALGRRQESICRTSRCCPFGRPATRHSAQILRLLTTVAGLLLAASRSCARIGSTCQQGLEQPGSTPPQEPSDWPAAAVLGRLRPVLLLAAW